MFIDKNTSKEQAYRAKYSNDIQKNIRKAFHNKFTKGNHSYNNQTKRYIVSLLPDIVLRDSTFNNYYATSGGFTFHVPADCDHEVLLA